MRLAFSGRAEKGGAEPGGDVHVTVGRETATAMPDLGVALPSGQAAGFAAVEALRALGPRFLVCDVDAGDGRGLAELEIYREAAASVGAQIVLEIVVPDDQDAAASLAKVAAAAERAQVKPDAVIVSSASDLKSWQPGAKRPEKPTVDEIAKAAHAAFPGVRLGGGMLSTFTELNRKRPKAELFDYIAHSTCSIVHAADDRSAMETLETLPAIIASTKAMTGGKPYRIGPSAVAARSNPYGKGLLDNPGNGRVCLTDRDPRQRGGFNAAWTLGYVAACAYGGLEAVALGAATGPLGFIHRKGDPAPYFDSLAGSAVYPAFHVLAGLGKGRGRPLLEARASAPGRVAALAWREDGRPVLWLANLTPEPVAIRLDGLDGRGRHISAIDAAVFERCASDPHALDALRAPLKGDTLRLDAYAAARID